MIRQRMPFAPVLTTLCLFLASATHAQDPGDPGPLAFVRAEYDYGDDAFRYSDQPTELRAVVYYPQDLSGGPFPLVVFLHGYHPTCYLGTSSFLQWPCTPPREPIPSYVGYEYEQQILASYGYIVVSISANGVNARDTLFFDQGMTWRAALIQRHLDQWSTFNTTGADPFGDLFVGKVDLTRVGTMGHSRGGGGVARHYNYNRELGSPYGVRAVFPLAPVDRIREVLDSVNIAVLLPYCDGDVSDLQGVHYFDDARYIAADQTNKHYVLVMGGNHSFYNTIWAPGGWPAATWDDWLQFEDPPGNDPFCGTHEGNHRLTQEQVHGTLRAYLTGFMRTYLGGEDFLSILKGDSLPPPSAMTNEIHVSYHPKDAPGSRLTVNSLLFEGRLSTNDLGQPVTPNGLNPYDLCGGEDPEPAQCLEGQPTRRQPHTTPSPLIQARGLSQLRFGWDDALAQWTNQLPDDATSDVSGYAVVQLRAGVNFADARNPSVVPQDFSMVLTDRAGNSASVLVSDNSNALYYPPGQLGAVPKVVLNTIRIRLAQFIDVDLTQVQSVRLDFNQRDTGALLLTDLIFAD
jgi:hypothetical protein